jgi:hypothetical protein
MLAATTIIIIFLPTIAKQKRFHARSLSYAARSQMFDVTVNLPSTSK